MMPTSFARSITSNAPIFFDDINRIASKTMASGGMNHISRLLRSKMALTSPTTFMLAVWVRQNQENYTTNPEDGHREFSCFWQTGRNGSTINTQDDKLFPGQKAFMSKLLLTGLTHPGTFELEPGFNAVGRNPTNDFRLQDATVSSFHCEIVVSEDSVLV